jgi:cellulose biosynthesis protein BcsQ
MKIVAVYNIKGGVGKTATAVNLAYLAAEQGLRTLIWDLDPQGATSFYFRVKPKVKGSTQKLLQGQRELQDLVKGTDFERLDLLPADFSYRNMDLVFDDAKKPTLQLLRLLRPLAREYDQIILDCPPNISLASENVFRAADALLVPLIPTTLSLRTFRQLTDFVADGALRHLQLLPFFSMVDRRKRMHLDIMEQLPREQDMLTTHIPYASDVERMGVFRAPVQDFAAKSPAALAYRELWGEVCGRLC